MSNPTPKSEPAVGLDDSPENLSKLKKDMLKKKALKEERRNAQDPNKRRRSVGIGPVGKKPSKSQPNWLDIATVSSEIRTVLEEYQNFATDIGNIISVFPEELHEQILADVKLLQTDTAAYIGKHVGTMLPIINKSGLVTMDEMADYLLVYENLMTLSSDIIAVLQPTAELLNIVFQQYNTPISTEATIDATH